MKSPCIELCIYDYKRNYCTGCFRTLKEIGHWESMTEEEKRKTMEGAAERSATGPEHQGT